MARGCVVVLMLSLWPEGSYSTGVGEQRLIVLADGSRMTLNTATDVRVTLTDAQRSVFYPANRMVRSPPTPRLDTMMRRKAAVIRQRIEATVRRLPQVMVKVTGGGRGMGAIAAHFRDISKNGRLAIEDDREVVRTGKDDVCDLVDQWRYGGAFIEDVGHPTRSPPESRGGVCGRRKQRERR